MTWGADPDDHQRMVVALMVGQDAIRTAAELAGLAPDDKPLTNGLVGQIGRPGLQCGVFVVPVNPVAALGIDVASRNRASPTASSFGVYSSGSLCRCHPIRPVRLV